MTNQNKQRVLMTGYGAITAAGDTIDSTWQAVQKEESGLAPITMWDTTDWPFKIGGEIKNYNPRTMIKDRKLLKVISRHDVIGLNAVAQAVEHSGLIDYRDNLTDATEFNDRTGVLVGSPGNKFTQQHEFMPLFTHAQQDMQKFAEGLFSNVHPMWLLKILPNNVLAYAGIQYGFKGYNQNITNHVVSGLQAVIEATHLIQRGKIDRAVVIAYDNALDPHQVLYFGGLGTLTSGDTLRPFDANRDGTLLAEGAAAIVLESEAAAKERGAKVYGEILAGSSYGEAQGIFAIDAHAEALSRSMKETMRRADVNVDEIGMICAHGNGNVQSDATEALAINDLFSKQQTPVSTFKWALGHSLCASGVSDLLLTLLSLQDGTVPGIATLTEQAEDCQGINVSRDIQPTQGDTGLVLSRGFAGLNASVLIKKSDA